MSLNQILTPQIQEAVQNLYQVSIDNVEYQATRKEFEGDITVVVFPLLKQIKGNPADIGAKIGDYLVQHTTVVDRFNVVKGFLNLVISDAYYLELFNEIWEIPHYGFVSPNQEDKAVLVPRAGLKRANIDNNKCQKNRLSRNHSDHSG